MCIRDSYIPRFFDLYIEEGLKCSKLNETIHITDIKQYNASGRNENNCTFEYNLKATKMRIGHNYVLWYVNISNFLLTVLVPVGVLTYLNCKIHSLLHNFMARQPSSNPTELRKIPARAQVTSDVKQVFILFSIVIVLVICHSLRVVLNIDEFIDITRYKEDLEKGCNIRKFWNELAVRINQLLIIMNASANFFIYVCMDKGFQKVLRKCFCVGPDEQNNKFINATRQTEQEGVTIENKNIKSNDMELLNVNSN